MGEQPTSQLRWKRKRKRKKKRRRRKRSKNKYFLTFLLRPSDSPSNHLLHLKSSITSTQHPPHIQSSKKNKRSVFVERMISSQTDWKPWQTSRQPYTSIP